MNDEDRLKAVTRVRMNMTGIKSSEFKRTQCIEAFLDAKTWLLCAITFFGQVPNGALTTVSWQLSEPHVMCLAHPELTQYQVRYNCRQWFRIQHLQLPSSSSILLLGYAYRRSYLHRWQLIFHQY